MDGYKVSWKRVPLLRPDSNWHARLITIDLATVQSWDFTNAALDAAATFADTCQSLTFDTDNNGHFFTPPAALPRGWYLLQFIDAEIPAVTDQPICKLIYWDADAGLVTWIGDL